MSATSTSDRANASSQSSPFSNEATIPIPSVAMVRVYAASSLRLIAQARMTSAAPARLAAKCESSITPSGSTASSALNLLRTGGVAPETMRITPATNVVTLRICGRRAGIQRPTIPPARLAYSATRPPCRCSSNAMRKVNAITSGIR